MGLSAWGMVVVLSGTYDQLLDYVIFASWLLYGMTTATVLVLRRKRPDLARPYRTLGYPVVPVLFVIMSIAIVISALYNSPRESLLGLALILAGLPFYFHWRKQRSRA
jgi:APA family basic amino acid/polyamine antiporter